MIIEAELRSKIADALAGESSLDELYSWLMSRSWNMHRDSSPSAVDLAADVEHMFFELSDGVISEDVVRRRLSKLINEVVVSEAKDITREQRLRLDYLKMAKILPQFLARPVAA